ncbi:MAG: hypothetical protein PHT02_01990 [Tissierellia bacterium]|nr:hypothetical protein [Tissierellia bacterium]
MKAVIVEIRDKYAAALSDDGRIYKIKNENYIIGQRIEVKKKIFNKGYTKFIATIAAACAIFAVPGWAYYTPYSYVSMDINPSIEYSINRFDRVINVNSLNEDGEGILNGINLNDLRNKNIEVAIKKVLGEIIEDGYIVEDECDIVIATSSKNEGKSDELNLKLKTTIEEEIKKETNISNVQVNAIKVDNSQVQAAKELGVTPGKLNLVNRLQETAEYAEDTEEINVEEWLEKPVKEIVKAQNQYKNELKKEEKAEKKEEKKAEKENKKEEKIEKEEKKAEKEEIKNNKNVKKNNIDNSNKKNSDNEINKDNKNNANNNIDNTKNNKVEKEDKNDKVEKEDKSNNNSNKNNGKNEKNDKNNKVKKSDSNSENKKNKSKDKKDKKDEDIIEIDNLICTITSINEKDSSITILRSNDKSLIIYLENNTKIINLNGKSIKINDLKENYKLNIDLEYKNERFVATFIEIIENN